VKSETQFEAADGIFEGLANLRPEVLRRVLRACTNVKAKRLFFFADRHTHGWARTVAADDFDLGSGKRQVAAAGRLDERYQITIPRGMMRIEDHDR
jgi:hypothetical protein